jgi:ATP-dependent protease ClpP protease subunit
MAAILEDGKLRLSGYVGDYYYDDGFTSNDVVIALAQIEADSDLDVFVNSPGGIATEGAAIHALLSARPGITNIIVEGIAASAASLIAMAGATVTMSAGAVMMIHDPSGMTWGTSDDHAKTIEGLEALATAYARVYSAKSGKTAEECREIMKAERWFTPDQAVDEGFADATTETKAKAVAAFDYRIFAHAPQKLKTLASKKNWSLPEPNTPAGTAATTTSTGDDPMGDKERADQLAAENDKLKGDVTTAAADATKATAATAADIVDLCNTAGVPTMASSLIREGVSMDLAKARTSNAKDIRAAVDLARKSCPTIEANAADAFIAAGMSMDGVRAKLFEQITGAQSAEITSAHQSTTGEADEAKAEAAKVVASIQGVNGNTKKGSAA